MGFILRRLPFDELREIGRLDSNQAPDLVKFEAAGAEIAISSSPGDLEKPHGVLNRKISFHLKLSFKYIHVSCNIM
jgi:hypothetical protein